MNTTCYKCGRTDSSDLSAWGRNEIGWYHKSCQAQVPAEDDDPLGDGDTGEDCNVEDSYAR